MYLILLKFTEHKARAAEFMAGHKCWLQTGFEQGLLVMAGSLGDGTGSGPESGAERGPEKLLGGALLGKADSLQAMAEFVSQDPFVAQQIVRPEILHITPSRLDPRLEFLRTAAS